MGLLGFPAPVSSADTDAGSPDPGTPGAEPPQGWAENTVSGLGSRAGSASYLHSKMPSRQITKHF